MTILVVALSALALVGVSPAAASENAAARAGQSSAAPKPPIGFSSRFADVNGIRMHYVRGGKGDPVVLLHGFPQSWYEWKDMLKPLAERHTVIAVDLRGTGQTSAPRTGYDKRTMADDVYDLLRGLDLERGVRIVGHDIGLQVAYAYASAHRAEVRQMAVLEAPIPDEGQYRFPALAPSGPSQWHFGAFQEKWFERMVLGNQELFVRSFISEFLQQRQAFSRDDFRLYARYLDRAHLRGWFEIYRAWRRDARVNERLRERKLEMPVLAIGGESGLGQAVLDQWPRYATNVQGAIIEDSGHWIPEERPEQLTRRILSFFAQPCS